MSENLLGTELSPYLLQHKDNPVHWQPWGQQALARAAREDKPILLSIGYAACHWCHVMAHESFEDLLTAQQMNASFINIKVDREERPDIDQIYMAALHLFGEQGGWPLTMFLAPDGQPFWGGTYFPPEPRWGRPSFRQVLTKISDLYRDDRQSINHNRSVITERLRGLSEPGAGDALTPGDIEAAANLAAGLMDPVNGGLKGHPKFPQFSLYELVARAGLRRSDPNLISLYLTAMERIFEGGIYDHLAGGLARYSVDNRWLVPHFEKMLYDNASAISALCLAHTISPLPLFRQRIEEIIAWLDLEMMTACGAYSSSIDADSEGEEGRYYVWTKEEIVQALGTDECEFFCQFYDVDKAGNWEGKTILNRLNSSARIIDDTDFALSLLRERLLSKRNDRPRPATDDKVLTDWNGLTISALSKAGMVFERPDWIDRAASVFRSITESNTLQKRLLHSSRNGQPGAAGLAGDYTNMILAALDLYASTTKTTYLTQAESWTADLEEWFSDGKGAFYLTSKDSVDLIVRPRTANDDATPSANAKALEAYARLECFTGNTSYGKKAQQLGCAFSDTARNHPIGYASLFNGAEPAMRPIQIVIVGEDSGFSDLVKTAFTAPTPTACVMRVGKTTALPEDHPAHSKPAGPKTTAYVCINRSCSLPITDPQHLHQHLAASYRATEF